LQLAGLGGNESAGHLPNCMAGTSLSGMQYFYSLAGRDIESVRYYPWLLDQNLAVMPWSPLAGGFLGGKYSRDNEKAGGTRRDTFDFPPINKEKTYDIIDVITEVGKQYNASTVAAIALGMGKPLQKGSYQYDYWRENCGTIECIILNQPKL
jgi:aryl-alcohol dehydrogenase-like predicted oxidoreductase